MNRFILATLCFVAVIASPTLNVNLSESEKAPEYVKIPDGFGGMKYVNINDEALMNEIDPTFDIPNDVRFLLFTRLNPLVGQVIPFNNMAAVLASNFITNAETKFIVHGWGGSATSGVNTLSRNAYLQAANVNVIVVDWSVGAGNANYITSRNFVGPVGAHCGDFINNMVGAGLITANHVSCAGHSLGAHVCGFVGKSVGGPTGGQLHSVFGLDPAGPLFFAAVPATRLAENDAQYTEAIHTDIVALGIGDPICHTDFYPNGGTGMPGCDSSGCDHGIVVNYFAESINSPNLWGRRCASIADKEANNCPGDGFSMGGIVSNRGINLRGIFRMPTNAASPFGIGQF